MDTILEQAYAIAVKGEDVGPLFTERLKNAGYMHLVDVELLAYPENKQVSVMQWFEEVEPEQSFVTTQGMLDVISELAVEFTTELEITYNPLDELSWSCRISKLEEPLKFPATEEKKAALEKSMGMDYEDIPADYFSGYWKNRATSVYISDQTNTGLFIQVLLLFHRIRNNSIRIGKF